MIPSERDALMMGTVRLVGAAMGWNREAALAANYSMVQLWIANVLATAPYSLLIRYLIIECTDVTDVRLGFDTTALADDDGEFFHVDRNYVGALNLLSNVRSEQAGAIPGTFTPICRIPVAAGIPVLVPGPWRVTDVAGSGLVVVPAIQNAGIACTFAWSEGLSWCADGI